MGIGTSSSSSGASAPRANAYAVNRDASELRRSPARKAPASAQPGPMHVIYMSVHTGIQAAHRTDSHGHCPQNRLTCANQQAELCAPKRIQPGRTCAEARQTNHSRGGAALLQRPTTESRPRHYPPTPDTRTPQADGAPRYLPSQHDSEGQPEDQGPDVPAGRRPAGLAAHGSSSPAAADDVPVPAQHGVRRDQQPQPLAPRFRDHAEQRREQCPVRPVQAQDGTAAAAAAQRAGGAGSRSRQSATSPRAGTAAAMRRSA